MSTRISYKTDFELCLLRHQYLRKAKRTPTNDEMVLYKSVVENIAKNTYYVYKNLFLLVGLDLEDILSVAQTQLVSFLGLFSLECNQVKLTTFKKTRKNNYGKCTKKDILDKNKADFTCFLKQRMEDLVRICKQKAKNIKGLPAEEFLVFTGKKRPPNDIEELLNNHREYGFKQIEISTFKALKRNFNPKMQGPVYLVGNTWFVCVPAKKKVLEITDFTCQDIDPYANIHNMTPEEICENKQEHLLLDRYKSIFNNLPNQDKNQLLTLFLEQNKEDPEFKAEVKAAKKILENLSEPLV